MTLAAKFTHLNEKKPSYEVSGGPYFSFISTCLDPDVTSVKLNYLLIKT